MRLTINLLLGLALVLYLTGIFAPVFTLSKFIWFENTVSIASGLYDLLREGEWLLFLIIFCFSILFPLAKIVLLCVLWNRPSGTVPERLHWLEQISRWSMLDVFLIALLVASVKLGMLAEMTVHYGLYAFALSVILMMGLTHVILRKK